MKTYWQSSKKFLILSSLFIVSTASAGELIFKLENEIENWKGKSFEPLIDRWEKEYGSSAVSSLTRIARNKNLHDRERYVALMGAAKLGGPDGFNLWSTLIHDSSWVIRGAVLRASRISQNEQAKKLALEGLKDKALVVRLEAVETLAWLKPKDWEKALLGTLSDERNFHKGRPLWVPTRALRALTRTQEKALTAQEIENTMKKLATLKPVNSELSSAAQETLKQLKL